MESSLADALENYDAAGLAEQIKLRKLSVVDVVEAHFQRIAKLNRKYNALVTLDEQRALQRAREADDALAQGKLWGPLHGVPVTIKDAIETAGLRTTVGYTGYSNFVPDKDAPVVSRLKGAGAIVIGKTNCAALCGDIQTTNKLFGKTSNPWDVGRTSGGSSGGDAVAVALGMSALGIGSDTGGSIRIPSSYCGVFGLKTSLGKVPRQGLRPVRDESHARPDRLTVIGSIARSIRDLALCYGVLTGQVTALASTAKPKIFWTHEFHEPLVDDDVAQVLGEKFSALTAAGADITKIESPVDFRYLFTMSMRLGVYEFWPEEAGKLIPGVFLLYESLRSLLRGGAAGSYARLKREQSEMSSRVARMLAGCDFWVLPATPSVAFEHRRPGAAIPLTLAGRVRKSGYWRASAGFTYPISLLGNPSIVIPVGMNKDGMPIAIQAVGKMGEDAKLLSAASYLAGKIGRVPSGAGDV